MIAQYMRFVALCGEIKNLYYKNQFHKRTGKRFLTFGQVQERLDICKECDHFDGKRCNLCGCCNNAAVVLFQFVAYPTKQCPDNPPKWGKIE